MEMFILKTIDLSALINTPKYQLHTYTMIFSHYFSAPALTTAENSESVESTFFSVGVRNFVCRQ